MYIVDGADHSLYTRVVLYEALLTHRLDVASSARETHTRSLFFCLSYSVSRTGEVYRTTLAYFRPLVREGRMRSTED